jgi:hypothetical protein
MVMLPDLLAALALRSSRFAMATFDLLLKAVGGYRLPVAGMLAGVMHHQTVHPASSHLNHSPLESVAPDEQPCRFPRMLVSGMRKPLGHISSRQKALTEEPLPKSVLF